MKRLLLLAATLSLAACVGSATIPAAQPAGGLDWLAGCWETEDGRVREQWTVVNDGLAFGFGTTTADGEIVFFEQLRIETGDAGLLYSAYPAGVGPTQFRLTDSGPGRATFDNPEHDFPQRLGYRRDGAMLRAMASLADGTRARSWSYRRCR